MTSRSYKARGIVLRARNLGESDKIYTLFTDAHGKCDMVAKGARRLSSRTASRLEFGAEAFLLLYRGRTLDTIVSAEPLRSRRSAITRPAGYVTAHLMIELVDVFCEPGLPIPEVYALLNGALDALATVEDPPGLIPRFEARLLVVLGFAPYATVCVECGCGFEGKPAWAHLEAGGLACEECTPYGNVDLMLEPRDIVNFRSLAAPRASGARAAVTATPAAARAIDAFVLHHLGRQPKSHAFLREMPFLHF